MFVCTMPLSFVLSRRHASNESDVKVLRFDNCIVCLVLSLLSVLVDGGEDSHRGCGHLQKRRWQHAELHLEVTLEVQLRRSDQGEMS